MIVLAREGTRRRPPLRRHVPCPSTPTSALLAVAVAATAAATSVAATSVAATSVAATLLAMAARRRLPAPRRRLGPAITTIVATPRLPPVPGPATTRSVVGPGVSGGVVVEILGFSFEIFLGRMLRLRSYVL